MSSTIAAPAMSARTARRLSRIATGTLIALLLGVPLAYILLISFQTPAHFIADPTSLIGGYTVDNYAQAWERGDLGRQLANTAFYAVSAATISTVLSVLISYPIARRLVKAHRSLYLLFVIGVCLPLPIIPLFVLARAFGLYDNPVGYIVLQVAPGLPLGVLMLTAFIAGIPNEIDEAAFLDGSGYLRFVFRFVVPLAWPSIVIVFLYSLLAVWNDIIAPIVFLTSSQYFPVTRGVYQFFGATASSWTIAAAAIVIVSIPVALLFIVSQRHLLRSTVGASL
ncbi:MAG: carbohydrate ABC transporter permease [Microbacterium sp.]